MPEIFIDDVRYEYEEPQKVLQFMLDKGLDLPFFCYHPSLSIPANCRQCLVQAGTPVKNRETNEYELDEEGNRAIRFFPKLMTSCSLDMADGMVVKSHKTSELVKRAQADNLEFILINHPLDCPICDQAGECPLQIQTYKYGPEGSRFEHKKVHKPKRYQLGPRVVLDAERCINCTRCVRFTEEISKSNQLSIISRGDKNYPMTFPGDTFDDPYSLNTVDICPVGALTSADFRFRARVWEMNQTPSIDVTNGKGCNIDIWTRDNVVMRITPRFNKEVNDHWMPDVGRLGYTFMNENRVSKPQIKLDGKEQAKTSWNNALLTFAEKIQEYKPEEFLLLGSPFSSVEDNYVMAKFFNELGQSNVHFVPHIIEGSGDNLLLSEDQAPNTNGCRLLNFEEDSEKKLTQVLQDGQFKVIVILGDDLLGHSYIDQKLFDDKFVITFATNISATTMASDLVIPMTCSAEHAASYVNIDGRIQRTVPAKETLYTSRRLNLEMSLARLDHYGTKFDNWVKDSNRVDCIPAWEFFVRVAKEMDRDLDYSSSREIMAAIVNTNPDFQDVTYEKMDDVGGIILKSSSTVAG
ncbi:MAG: molybdopterin-dependent oxidoreductase [Balneolales bacterium]